MTNFLKPVIEITDPVNPPSGVRELTVIEDKLNFPERFDAFYVQGDHLSVIRYWVYAPNIDQESLAVLQFDAPLKILPWFIETFEFFIESPSEGGFAAGKIVSPKATIAGEQLTIGRLMHAGNERHEGGYIIDNYSRKEHGRGSLNQSCDISDSYFFHGGFYDTWKELAEKYKNGTL
ncbi:hypothetical protein [Flocculibacter collagenilyticus]|uniref:hypothetical protein n=1 Tax=Flocculibacter collagenilyticus TaxID=2744479 RepID=UPI0018F5031C|nr:hypothetical protein [Flocculibacter collagenilyticus]